MPLILAFVGEEDERDEEEREEEEEGERRTTTRHVIFPLYTSNSNLHINHRKCFHSCTKSSG